MLFVFDGHFLQMLVGQVFEGLGPSCDVWLPNGSIPSLGPGMGVSQVGPSGSLWCVEPCVVADGREHEGEEVFVGFGVACFLCVGLMFLFLELL